MATTEHMVATLRAYTSRPEVWQQHDQKGMSRSGVSSVQSGRALSMQIAKA
jgi:hypothetical protein